MKPQEPADDGCLVAHLWFKSFVSYLELSIFHCQDAWNYAFILSKVLKYSIVHIWIHIYFNIYLYFILTVKWLSEYKLELSWLNTILWAFFTRQTLLSHGKNFVVYTKRTRKLNIVLIQLSNPLRIFNLLIDFLETFSWLCRIIK